MENITNQSTPKKEHHTQKTESVVALGEGVFVEKSKHAKLETRLRGTPPNSSLPPPTISSSPVPMLSYRANSKGLSTEQISENSIPISENANSFESSGSHFVPPVLVEEQSNDKPHGTPTQTEGKEQCGSAKLRRKNFTKEEDQQIEEGVALYGHDWDEIARRINIDRTSIQIRDRYRRLARRNSMAEDKSGVDVAELFGVLPT